MYGKTARACKAFEFGCQPPTGGEQAARAEMRGRVTLWNRFVEIEQTYRERRETILATHAPELVPLQAAAEAARVDLDVVPADSPDRPALRTRWREHVTVFRDARRAAFQNPDLTEPLRDADAARVEQANGAMRASALYWCNSGDVRAAYELARRKPGELRFHSWRREPGKLTVRFQTGLPLAEAFATDTRVRLVPVDPALAYDTPVRAVRRKAVRSVLQVRIGSDEHRAPLWLVLPVFLHRPMPAGGLIRSVSVLAEQLGTAWRWKAILVVELPRASPEAMNPGPGLLCDHREPAAALDVGWRRIDGGLRIASWRGSDGASGTLMLPERWLGGMAQVERLRGYRDDAMNAARALLLTWLHQPVDAEGTAVTVPEWMTEGTVTLGQWHAPERLSGLVWSWRAQRFDGDGPIFDGLDVWRTREHHLHSFEDNLRDRLLRNRRERYRIFAADLTRRYRALVLEEFDLRPMAAVQDQSAPGAELPEPVRRYRVLAAVSVLRRALADACRARGVTLTTREAAYTTQKCHVCGHTAAFDAAAELVHQCQGCGVVWDQDANAAANLLAEEMPVAAG